jgi:hypothetical protein
VSTERLMREREFYSPAAAVPSAQHAFARWTKRLSVASELDAARELAGLSDVELAELEAEFQRSPMRARSPAVRHAVVGGLALVVVGGFGLALQAGTNLGELAVRLLQAGSVAGLLLGLMSLGVGVIASFSTAHLDVSHGTAGLHVGKLDEQHPWLYRAAALATHRVADDYRQRTLLERGALRGMDYVMMRELVRAQEALASLRAARVIADELQLPAPQTQAFVQERRLVQVGSIADRRFTATDSEECVTRVAAN